MQIAGRSGEFDLVVIQAAQSVGDRGNALGEHGGIGNDQGIGFQFFAIFLNVVPQADAANFFFAFDQYFYVNAQATVERFAATPAL